MARGVGRYAAPIALIVVILAMVMIVGNTGGNGDDESATTGTTATQTTGSAKTRKPPKTYRVREGDTLASIALKSGINEERLSVLNPGLDPNAIQVGQRIRLRP